MSTTTPQPPNPSPEAALNDASRTALIHNVSLGALIVCPIIMLLPPRKFDIYTVALMTGTFFGGNQIALEYTGRSFVGRCKARLDSVKNMAGAGQLPEKAREVQRRLREEKAARERALESGPTLARDEGRGGSRVLDELQRKKEEKERGILEKVWMGSEGDDWKEKRDQKEKEALEEGKGYGGLIMDQIWEVWNWGEDKTKEIKEKDEEVVRERNARKDDVTGKK